MKTKIALQSFLVLALVFMGSSFVAASEVTGTLGSGQTSGHTTQGSLSGSVGSSNNGSGGGGTIGGTVSGGSNSSSTGGGSGRSTVQQNAVSSTGSPGDVSQERFISADGTALEPRSGSLAFNDSGDSNPGFGEFGIMEDIPAQVVATADTSTSTWAWVIVLVLAGLATIVYLYVRSAGKNKGQGI